jgi:N,N'-diacetyllegionaminate synthase
MKIGSVDLNKDVLIIAEIGNNHEGNFKLAKDMIAAAANAGAQAVKFQTILPDKLVSVKQKKTISLFEKFKFSEEQFTDLKNYADEVGVMFLSTPFDTGSALFLNPLMPAFKIASGDNNYWPLIQCVADTGKPIILSTGMADFESICKAKEFIESRWKERGISQNLVILHCVSLYPTPPNLANLSTVSYLLDKLGGTIGFSDHTIGIEAAALAVGLGARVIEKHFTFDKNYSDFPDHAISMDPDDLTKLVQRVKSTVSMLGTYGVVVDEQQREVAKGSRRSIVSKNDLSANTKLEWEHLDWVRPADGLPPGEEDLLIGKLLKRDISRGYIILPEDVAN